MLTDGQECECEYLPGVYHINTSPEFFHISNMISQKTMFNELIFFLFLFLGYTEKKSRNVKINLR